jgi:hypothetical protein
MRRLLLLLLVLVAPVASAAWYPSLETGALNLRVGQSATVQVRAIWTGTWIVPWSPWYFESTNPGVARVTGSMLTSQPGTMYITALAPGRTNAYIQNWSDFYRVEITVTCGSESPVQAAEARQATKVGEAVTLRALTPIATRTTFTWYHGRIGDTSMPIAASGPELVYATDDPGVHYAWVLATTPCSSSTAEFEIEAITPKRRASRH